MRKSYLNSGVLILMVIAFLFTYIAFPYLYEVIFDVKPYFNSYIVVFPIFYALMGTLRKENRLNHFSLSIKTGLITFIPGFVLSFFYFPGKLAYFALFYYFQLKEHEKNINVNNKSRDIIA